MDMIVNREDPAHIGIAYAALRLAPTKNALIMFKMNENSVTHTAESYA